LAGCWGWNLLSRFFHTAFVENHVWPCQQRLVPELSAGTYWTGAPIPDGDYDLRPDGSHFVFGVSKTPGGWAIKTVTF